MKLTCKIRKKLNKDCLNLDLCTVECPEPGCAYSTSSLSSLQSHRLIHGRKNARLKQSRTCPACRIFLETPKAIHDHVLECHSEVIEKIVHCILDEQCAWQNDLGMFFIVFTRFLPIRWCADVCGNLLSHFFDKKFVKVMFLLQKLLKS